MGKALLIAVAAFILASAYYNLAIRSSQADTARVTTEHQLKVLARGAALNGYHLAKQAIADVGDLTPFVGTATTFDGTYDGSPYVATIESDGSTATIESTGEASNGVDRVTHVVTAVIGSPSGASATVPPFMTYALISEDDLNLSGNIGGYVADAEPELNANFHTNGNLHVNGNAADVAGFGSFAGMGTANPNKALANTFSPHFNPDDLDTVFQSGTVDIPAFEIATFLSNVTADQTSPGNVVLAGDQDLGGTKEDPYVWHVQGDLTASGGSSVNGYVMFLVEGDIRLSGNLTAGPGQHEESSIALYSANDVTLTGNIQIHGQIYAGDDVIFKGTPDIYGSVAAGGSAVLNGTPGIHYRRASAALTRNFAGESDLALLSYFEY